MDTSKFAELPMSVGPLELPGILSYPTFLDKPIGVVTLIAGSGFSDQDGTFAALKPYKDIAWGLATAGVAVLRYPKRFSVHPPLEIHYTYEEEYMIDCEAAVDLLFEKYGIPVTPTSHSEGGKIVPLLASRKPDKVGSFISLSGKVEKFIPSYVRQVYYMANVSHQRTSPEINKNLDEMMKISKMIDDGTCPPDYRIPPLLFTEASSVSAEYLISLHKVDNVGIANSLNIPFLVTNGDKDYQATIDLDFNVWKERNTNPKGKFQEFEDMHHFLGLQNGIPHPEAYYTPQNVNHVVIEAIVEFLKNLKDEI